MTVEEAIDRLTTIDQLPEVGPDLVQEASECLDTIVESNDHDSVMWAATVYKDTVRRAVAWNP